jgi:signal transduction histidine kinase
MVRKLLWFERRPNRPGDQLMSSNILAFPGGASGHVGAAFLKDPPEHSHAVQFYDDDQFLFETVGRFLAAGLQTGDRLVVIATEPHRAGIAAHLEPYNSQAAIASGQLVLLDARQTLSKFMVGDLPDPDLFRDVLSRVIMQLRETGAGRVRAYGEMVDLLWRDGNSRAAIRLEELWNDAGKEHAFSLLCAYMMNNFFKQGDAEKFMAVCRNHSHVMPTESFTQLEDPHARLREISLLQQRARSLETELVYRKELEDALRDALRERGRAEDELRACIKREQEARTRAEASDAFKEMFLGILGHDLRNPLNTIMTTVDLMILRGDLSEEICKRLGRVSVSGIRMKRMIEQLLDMTRARLGQGFPIEPREQDVLPLVSKIVEEVQATHPARTIDVRADAACRARVDGDRFEQVVSNLLGNAVAHGDAARPITITLGRRDNLLSVCVHNHGPAIPPALQDQLFDPFTRGKQTHRSSDGLGLGLYISDRIVAAHGGKIEVRSAVETGTELEILLPTS